MSLVLPNYVAGSVEEVLLLIVLKTGVFGNPIYFSPECPVPYKDTEDTEGVGRGLNSALATEILIVQMNKEVTKMEDVCKTHT